MAYIANVIALGTICCETVTQGTIWGINLGDDVLRVYVDICVDENAIIPIPMSKEELSIKEVVGNDVPWPK